MSTPPGTSGTSTGRTPPGTSGHFLLGSLRELRRDPIALWMSVWRQHGDVARFWLGPSEVILVVRPEHVKQVLQDNHQNYRKTWFYRKMEPLTGKGLLTSDGAFWLRQRRLCQPAFQRQRTVAFAGAMTRATAAMLDRWAGPAARGEAIDVAGEMMRLALAIVAETLLGTDVEGEAHEIGEAITATLDHIHDKWSSLVDLPE